MEAFLTAIVASAVIVLDYLWTPRDNAQKQRLKKFAAFAAILIVWVAALIQWRSTLRAEKNTLFIKKQLIDAQADLTTFRKQAASDQVALVGNLMRTMSHSVDQAEYSIGTFAFFTGRNEEARDHFLNAIAANPRHSQAHNNLGLLLENTGSKDEAFEQFRLAFESDTNNAAAACNYANRLYQRGDERKAVEVMSKPSDYSDTTPAGFPAWASLLAQHADTNFWRLLCHYMKFSHDPKITELLPPLILGWGLLPANTRNQATNWTALFKDSQQRLEYQQTLESLIAGESLPLPFQIKPVTATAVTLRMPTNAPPPLAPTKTPAGADSATTP